MIKANIFSGDLNQADIASKDLYTGRFIVSTIDGYSELKNLRNVLSNKMGIKVSNSSDFESADDLIEENLGDADAIIYEEFGVALVGVQDDDQIRILSDSATDYVVEPELLVQVPELNVEVQSYATYGLQMTNAINSPYSGAGVKLAVLDTGFDLNHPDFNGRQINTQSFVPGESVQDINGHGTHCIGTAAGGVNVNQGRYGVAYDAEIYAGKVLGGPKGQGAQGWIINGMYAAVKTKCDIISMSLGSLVWPGQSYLLAYENIARYAVNNNTLVIAAAGNESKRQHNIFNPVGSPANCPSVMGVGAIDVQYNMADFSNRSINPNGRVDIVGPGVHIYSSWPMPYRYHTISGTSMATPHVAGIAALWKQKFPNASPGQLWQLLLGNALPLNQPSIDVGSGLVIAPL